MKKRYTLLPGMLAFALLGACGESPSSTSTKMQNDHAKVEQVLSEGAWRGVIEIQGKELPFQMEVAYPGDSAQPRVAFINGEERVPADRVQIEGDAVALVMPAFNTRIDAKLNEDVLAGTLTKITSGGKAQRMPVTITHGEQYRFFPMLKPADVDVSGRWAVTFTEPDGKTYPAVGEFEQQGSQVYGTFLTPTSDHRYLAGEVRDGRLYLSAWDGYHVFLYEADVSDEAMHGGFWSGASWHETWVAQRDENAELPDMDKQTYLKEGVEHFDFTFPDTDGNPVSLSDPRFQNKVVIVQLAGSWCPNCADETRFLAPWHRNNRDRGIEVVALMFEHFNDFDAAAEQVRIWRETYGVEYPTLVAGISDKQDAASRLPQLNAFLAFPTTLFIGRNGEVARIHTGFNGPATGARYEEEIAQFNATVDELLQEKH